MKNDKKADTNSNVEQQNAWYPIHASDRVDTLLGELDEAQILRLFHELQTMTYWEWRHWVASGMEEISQYDALSHRERKARLRNADDVAPLLHQYTIVHIELWRLRASNQYIPLPSHGFPLDDHQDQRQFVLATFAATYFVDKRELWPFEHPEIQVGLSRMTWVAPYLRYFLVSSS